MQAINPSGEVQAIYAATGGLDEASVEAALGTLSDDERSRADRFALPKHRRDFVAAHALLRRALSGWHPLDPRDWQFVAGRGGKPELAPPQRSTTRLAFNLAHTDGLVACAIGRDVEIGIDVEAIDRQTDALALAERYFSPAERDNLQRSDAFGATGRFIEIWTLKEAFVKATGAGVTRALDTFTFSVDEQFRVTFEPPPGESAVAWRFAMFAPLERYRMAVAVRASSPNQHTIVATAVQW